MCNKCTLTNKKPVDTYSIYEQASHELFLVENFFENQVVFLGTTGFVLKRLN